MITTIISLVLLIIAFFLISAVIFQPYYEMKSKASVFIPARKGDIESIETDIRTVMNDVRKNYKRTVRRVYIVNIDNDIGIAELSSRLCGEYDNLSVCGKLDILKIIDE